MRVTLKYELILNTCCKATTLPNIYMHVYTLKGQIFTALVLDFIKKEGKTAVVLEWKDVPVGVVNVKDKKQTLPHSHFVADYQILKP